jgi:hypothetical protein
MWGGGCASWNLDEGLGGRLRVIQDRRRRDTLQDGRRDVDINCDDGEILRYKSDGRVNLYRDFGGRPILLFSFCNLPSPLLLPALQPRGMDFTKFLSHKLTIMRRIGARITPYIQSRCIQFRSFPSEGVQYLEANSYIPRLEETLKQGFSCDKEKLVDSLGPVVVVATVGDQWFDEVPPHEVVAEQAALDEMSNKQRCAHKAVPSTPPNRDLQVSGWVLGCSYRKPSENVEAKFVNEGPREL